jgi:hypothetical protein
MTSKVYKSAQGKNVDLGTIMLQNEHVRAVGNMNVNARGDKLDSTNQVIETKPRQIQRQLNRTTNVSADPVQSSVTKAKRTQKNPPKKANESPIEFEPAPVVLSAPPEQAPVITDKIPPGGLAAAIARSREVKQQLEKTQRQQAQSQGLRKI